MILKSIKYNQFQGKPEEWILEGFTLGKINLIVGKNASGKTRTLNVIGGLANLVSGDLKLFFVSGDYEVTFQNDNKILVYRLIYEDAKITKEELIIGSEKWLDRGQGGEGSIYFDQERRMMRFQAPENELACVTRRDSVQHPFFEDIYQWGKTTRLYYFGSQLGKDHLAIPMGNQSKNRKSSEINLKETEKVITLLKKGIEIYGDKFKEMIKKDMGLIGYQIEGVGVDSIPGLVIQNAPARAEGLYVKESDLRQRTFQTDMSQGMFRALSLLIQLNFSQLGSIPSCILIDDIGEGLDYERSTALINILIEKAKSPSVQLFMATNDRFVMNNVPLEYWSVIQRIGARCKIFNHENSKKIFDDFKFTGLTNFDFLSSEFYLKGFDKN